MRTITCPHCGRTGFDDHSLPPDRESEAAFEMRGNLRRMPLYKCLSCSGGMRMTRWPFPRYEAISSEQWAELNDVWAVHRADVDERLNAVFDFQRAQANDPTLTFEDFIRQRQTHEGLAERLEDREFPSAEHAYRLGAELFRHDPQAYQRIASEIVADTESRPRLSSSAKRLVGEITYPLMAFYAEQPLGELEMTPFLKGLARVQGETISVRTRSPNPKHGSRSTRISSSL